MGDGLAISRVTKEDLAAGIVYGYLNKSPVGEVAGNSVNPLRSGQPHETEQLAQLGLDKNNLVFRPSAEQVDSAAFKVIVGEPKYTPSGEF